MATLEKNGECLAETLSVAASLPDRMRGLLGRGGLPAGHALLIDPCPSVHTFFMQFSIDLLFLDRDWRVVRVVRNVSPFRVVFGGRGAARVIEMESGWFPEGAVSTGDRLTVVGGCCR